MWREITQVKQDIIICALGIGLRVCFLAHYIETTWSMLSLSVLSRKELCIAAEGILEQILLVCSLGYMGNSSPEAYP